MHRFRKPANSTGFQGFESLSARHFSHRGSSRGEITIIAETRSCWGVAQLVEQRLLVPQVARSNRAAPASYSRLLCAKHKHAQPPHGYGPHYGRVAERSIAAGLNPAGPFGGPSVRIRPRPPPTIWGVSSAGRAPVSHTGCRWFETVTPHHERLAQLEERPTFNRQVLSSRLRAFTTDKTPAPAAHGREWPRVIRPPAAPA